MAWKDGTRFTAAGKPHEPEPSFRDEQCLQCGFIGDGTFCTQCESEDRGVLNDGW